MDHEEDLLAVEEDENAQINAGDESLMAMIMKMNDNMNSVLTCLSQVDVSEIAQDYAKGAQTSDDVSQKLAEIINQRWSSKLEESKLKDKMSKYDRPNNCEKLTVPRVNPEIWSTLNVPYGSRI